MTDRNLRAEPKVGVLWGIEVGGRVHIVAQSVPLSTGAPYGDCITFDEGHATVWSQWRRGGAPDGAVEGFNQAIIEKEYDEVPRGRVVYHVPSSMFWIYLDRKLQHQRLIRDTKERFLLEGKSLRVYSDAHYRTNRRG